MLSDFQEKKKPFLALKKTVRIFESPKNCIFSKGLTHALGQKCQFFLSLDLVKIRLEITVHNFVNKKKNLFSL